MSSFVNIGGRLGNQIIRNTIANILCKKYNLQITYPSHTQLNTLGIELFNGLNIHNTSLEINDTNIDIYIKDDNSTINSNIILDGYFQTLECSKLIYQYFRIENIKAHIEFMNPYNN